jgi:hypothetical protein
VVCRDREAQEEGQEEEEEEEEEEEVEEEGGWQKYDEEVWGKGYRDEEEQTGLLNPPS